MRFWLLIAGLCWCSSSLAVTPTSDPIARSAESIRDELVKTRRDFHQHPELSNREERTAGVVAERLRALGLTVRTNIARHGVIGILKGGKPGPVVAWRADMDALPIQESYESDYRSQNAGVMHACGHDAHTAIGLGIATILSRMQKDLAGTVVFVFQPAEEGAPAGEKGGAALMLEEGALDDPKPGAIFGLHVWPLLPAGKIGWHSGPALAASDRFVATVHGKKVHASTPQFGVDAVLAAAQAVIAIQNIRSRRTDTLQPLVITVGSIHGGNRFNIIADEVLLEGTVRTLDSELQDRIPGMMQEVLTHATATVGATADLSYEKLVPATVNNPELTQATLPSLRRAVGADNLVESPPIMGAEDFSYFAQKIPGFYFLLGVSNQSRGITAMTHTPTFDLDEESLVVGVRAGAAVLLDWLAAPSSGHLYSAPR
ncbi:MAG: amidohydrolase [Acidobacteriota bacterium]